MIGWLRGSFFIGRQDQADKTRGTRTGRLSSDLQQIPRQQHDTPLHLRMKDLVVAPPGFMLLEADGSQMEMRVMAWISGDLTLRGIYNNGQDLYVATAAEVNSHATIQTATLWLMRIGLPPSGAGAKVLSDLWRTAPKDCSPIRLLELSASTGATGGGRDGSSEHVGTGRFSMAGRLSSLDTTCFSEDFMRTLQEYEVLVSSSSRQEPQEQQPLKLADALQVVSSAGARVLEEFPEWKGYRQNAKVVCLAFMYGMGAPKFVVEARTKYGIRFTLAEAQAFRLRFFQKFNGLPGYYMRQEAEVRRTRQVRTPLGRIRHLPDILSPDQNVAQEAVRQAINTPIQATASDLNTLAAIEADPQMPSGTKFLLPYHDATLWLVPEAEVLPAARLLKHVMEETVPKVIVPQKFGVTCPVPLGADIKVGRSWGEMKEVLLDITGAL